jgi:RimJ/RimL family protein N-acetyltransferase
MLAGEHLLTLRDGSEAIVRPIEPADRDALLGAFEELSEESRYRRFLSPMDTLGPSMLTYLTEVDHHDHEALIAFDPATESAIGVARFVRTDPDTAEAAVTVSDGWQGRGLGTAMTKLLAERALEEGIGRFIALLLADNRDMVDLLASIGSVRVTAREGGTIQVEVPLELDRPEAETGLYAVLRSVAARAARISHPLWPASKPEDET